MDGPTLMRKLINRMNPIFRDADCEYVHWKPIIRLRCVLVVQKWMEEFWAPDFQREDLRNELQNFIHMMSASFGSSEVDKSLDKKYLAKFKLLKSYMHHLNSNPRMNEKRKCSFGGKSIRPADISTAEKPKKNTSLIEIEPEEVSNAITVKEQELMMMISPKILSLHLWESQKDPLIAEMVKPIADLVNLFNTVFLSD